MGSVGKPPAYGPPLAVAAGAIGWIALRGIGHNFISFSDGVYLYASAAAAAEGLHTLYSHVALSLPPGAILAGSLAWRVSGHVESVRLLLGAVGVVVALLTYRAGRVLFGLTPAAAAAAAALAITGPLHNQFVALDGDTFLTPLVLGLALALERRRYTTVGVLLALGFFCKLTWLPFFVAAVAAIAVREGRGTAVRTAVASAAGAAGLYAAAMWAFGWSAHDVLSQLVLAESHSGLQLGLAPGLLLVLVLLWWPLLLVAPAGFRSADRGTQLLVVAGAASLVFMAKQGTFFNVLDPLEPLLALAAVSGAVTRWRGGRARSQVIVVLCAAVAALHAASVAGSVPRTALPIPLGAAVIDVDNEHAVDRIAASIKAHSTPDEPVLVNPFFAVVAGRPEPADAADWFILHALNSGRDWRSVKRLARNGGVAVVSVDSNVVSFDRTFAADTEAAADDPLLRVDAAPIRTALYAAPLAARSRTATRPTTSRPRSTRG